MIRLFIDVLRAIGIDACYELNEDIADAVFCRSLIVPNGLESVRLFLAVRRLFEGGEFENEVDCIQRLDAAMMEALDILTMPGL